MKHKNLIFEGACEVGISLKLPPPFLLPIALLMEAPQIQWNPSKADTIGTKNFVHCNEVSLAQAQVRVDHAPPIIAARYDKALLWTTKKTVLTKDLSTDSS